MKSHNSTAGEKAAVCLTAFGFSCGAFFLAALVLIPITGHLAESFSLPDLLTQSLIFIELIGLPIVAALWGVNVAARPIIARQLAQISVNTPDLPV